MSSAALDWQSIFAPGLGIGEVVVRGSIMYLALFVILRFIARRQAGQFGPADLLVIVLIADAAQNALGKDYTSVTEGIVLVLTIVGWEYLIDWIAWRFPVTRPWLTAQPLTLVENGKVLADNMQAEMLTKDELMSQLRQQGVEDTGAVRIARLEGNGRLSVFKLKS
jgi:uncharacterized membrane protein YcaP (DUF421 family)